MSKSQLAHSNRSVSDGDLVGDERKKAKNLHDTSIISENIDKQVFFTLPRWMSGRRKRNKIKNIKVDVPFTSYNEPRNLEHKGVSKSFDVEKKTEKSGNFIKKLFRSNSFFSSSKSNHSSRTGSRVPTSVISSSNSDVHCTSAANFQSFDYQECFKDKCPSVCGIKNHGNTCFMNAIIQCLSNTDLFAEYFVMGHYKTDLMRRNKTHSKRFGTRGEVTEQLGGLLKGLWSCQYYPSLSSKFKNTVAKYGAQYEGNEQHDAQEFLLWLLDKVHEDLNTAPKEKYKKTKGKIGRTDEDIAAEMLANHLRCNNSFIHDLFQGQFRSSLCCLGCGRFSNTFDPYLCISLPIPSSFNVSVYVHAIFLKDEIKMLKVGVSVDAQATVCDLREKLNISFGVPKENVLLLEILNGEYQRTFSDSDLVANFKDSKGIFAIEVPCKDKTISMESEKILLVFMNVLETDDGNEMLWRPFVLDICREVNFKDLVKEFLSAIKHIADQSDVDENSFSFCISDEESGNETICSSVDMPLYMPAIDKALLLCLGGIPHIKITVKWKKESKDKLKIDFSFLDIHQSVAELKNSKKPSDDATLYECFDLYFNEERLGNEDAWMCPHCNMRLPCVKTLSLWSTPDVLIVHLKRFRQSTSERTKITKFVEFPSSGLDLNSYVTTRNPSSQQAQSNALASMAFWSPWKRSRCRPYSRMEDNLYELYAVCNHHGSMQGGHYTAYCKNPINGHWYLYDDTKVQEVEASAVVSSDAYILFYQRSSLVSHSCASSSSSGYSSASSTLGPEHWAFHLSAFFRNSAITSKSQDTLFDIGKTSSLDRRASSSNRSFDRSSRAYSTMIHPSVTKSNSMKFDMIDGKQSPSNDKPYEEIEIPPPPPPAKHYWTVTSV